MFWYFDTSCGLKDPQQGREPVRARQKATQLQQAAASCPCGRTHRRSALRAQDNHSTAARGCGPALVRQPRSAFQSSVVFALMQPKVLQSESEQLAHPGCICFCAFKTTSVAVRRQTVPTFHTCPSNRVTVIVGKVRVLVPCRNFTGQTALSSNSILFLFGHGRRDVS